MKVSVEQSFIEALKRLPPDRAKAARNGLLKFQAAPNLPHLYFRALEGREGFFIIDLRRGDRIILRRESDDHYVAVDVGPHDNVYRRWNRLK